MRKNNPISVIYLILVLLSACIAPGSTAPQQPYFDLKELCEKIPHQLTGSSLTKTVTYQGKTTEFALNTTDTSYWQAELQLLRGCNINKAAFWGQYDLIRTDTSELYTAQNPSFKTRRLFIAKSPSGELRRVEAVFTQSTSFFDLSRRMEFEFEGGFLSHYRIGVFKKISLQDSVSFQTIGHLHARPIW